MRRYLPIFLLIVPLVAGIRRGSGIFNGSVYNSQRATINESQATLSTLAAETGGKAFLDSNDITAGITQAQQAMHSYYILGYYTTNNAENGKYRRIQMKLTNGMNANIFRSLRKSIIFAFPRLAILFPCW